MAAFLQNYGILILLGVLVIGLFVWISRRSKKDNPQQSRTGNQDDGGNLHRGGGGCCG